MTKKKYLTRKEIADIVETTSMSVGRNEQSLGLDGKDCKIVRNKRNIRYVRCRAEAALRQRGYEVPE